jgi:hypothetical protein
MKISYEKTVSANSITKCPHSVIGSKMQIAFKKCFIVGNDEPNVGGNWCKQYCKFNISFDTDIQIIECSYNDMKLDEGLFKI